MTPHASTSNTVGAPVSLADIEAAIKRIPAAQWTLISPDGRVWAGSQREVARALLQNVDVTSLFGSAP